MKPAIFQLASNRKTVVNIQNITTIELVLHQLTASIIINGVSHHYDSEGAASDFEQITKIMYDLNNLQGENKDYPHVKGNKKLPPRDDELDAIDE